MSLRPYHQPHANNMVFQGAGNFSDLITISLLELPITKIAGTGYWVFIGKAR